MIFKGLWRVLKLDLKFTMLTNRINLKFIDKNGTRLMPRVLKIPKQGGPKKYAGSGDQEDQTRKHYSSTSRLLNVLAG